MSANDRQVGGDHYKADIQHWDIVAMFDLDYFQGQITKYVMRWRSKGGVQDLEKAAHFLEKYIELNRGPRYNALGQRIEEDNKTEALIEQATLSEFAKVLKREDERAEYEQRRNAKLTKAADDGVDYEEDTCAHGNHVAECGACAIESDLRYDAERERRMFGK